MDGSDYGVSGKLDSASNSSASGTAEQIVLIGQLASELGLEPPTIRFYEDAGILQPQRLGRLRIYTRKDAQTLATTKYLRKLGVSVQQIKSLIDQLGSGNAFSGNSPVLAAFLRQHMTELLQRKSELELMIGELAERLAPTHGNSVQESET
jgi:DNA-binding transcriptional MerR regulator